MRSNWGICTIQVHTTQVELKLVAGCHGEDGLSMKRKVLGVFGGVSGTLRSIPVWGGIDAPNSIPARNEWMIKSKSLPWPRIPVVPCVLVVAAARFMATADAAIASAGCVRAACAVIAAASMRLSLSKALNIGMSADVSFCSWHIVAGPVDARLGTWIFMGSEMSSIRACQSREEVNWCDIFSGDMLGLVLH